MAYKYAFAVQRDNHMLIYAQVFVKFSQMAKLIKI